MKKIITLYLFILATAQFTFAQNATIAKLKFEEAEEAYASNNFEIALSKLNEVEAMLKSTNPKIMYLKICSQSKIIEANPFNDFTLIDNARSLSAKYLKDYEYLLPDNEDKYRDIYKISEKLKVYPATLQEFNTKIKQQTEQADALEVKKTEDIDKLRMYEENFKNHIYFKDLKIGLTLEETIKEYPRFKKYNKNSDPRITTMGCDYAIYSKEALNPNDVQAFYVKNKIVIGYGVTGINIENSLNELKLAFNFDPVVTIKEEGGAFMSSKIITYTWKKNNKSIELTQMTLPMLFQIDGTSVTTSIISLDHNFAQ